MRNLFLAFAILSSIPATGCVVESHPRPGHIHGWEVLGERVVNGRVDHDVIHVGRAEGTFRRLQVVVENSSLEMFDMVVTFGNGQRYEVPTRLVFRPGEATRVIDLPGDLRVIRRIDFRYGNLPGGGNARVVVYGGA